MQILNRFIPAMLFLLLCGADTVSGQAGFFPVRIGPGGGTAYQTGVSAQFTNPANLMIPRGGKNNYATIGMASFYDSHGLPLEFFYKIPDDIAPFFLPDEAPRFLPATETALNKRFQDGARHNRLLHYDIVPFGYGWMREESARAVAFRSRGFSAFEINRNWHETKSGEPGDFESLTRYLNAWELLFHEISFGFAREVTLFNRWFSGLNTLYAGFSPKVVFAGTHSDTRYSAIYSYEDGNWQNRQELYLRQSGVHRGYLSDLIDSGSSKKAFRDNMSRFSSVTLHGYGAGLDAGLTYIIPLGSDLALSPFVQEPLRKSIRFSISFTDLGMIRYHHQAHKSETSLEEKTSEPVVSPYLYDGKPGDFFAYLYADSSAKNLLSDIDTTTLSGYLGHLPAQCHLGTLFQYKRVVLSLDFSYLFGLQELQPSGWHSSFGTEIRPFAFLPLQFSIQRNADGDFAYGTGAGLDFSFLHLGAAMTLFQDKTNESTDELVNRFSFLSMEIRF